jgi:anthranilate synthase component 1
MDEESEKPIVAHSLIMDTDYIATPPDLFRSLCEDKEHCLLLESAEIQSKHNEKSILLIDAAIKFVCRGLSVDVILLSDNAKPVIDMIYQAAFDGAVIERHSNGLTVTFFPLDVCLDEDAKLLLNNPFSVLRYLINRINYKPSDSFAVFLGGVIAYDMVAVAEALPDVDYAENDCPDYVFYLAETLAVIDHKAYTTRLIANIFSKQCQKARLFSAHQRLETIKVLIESSKRKSSTLSSLSAHQKVKSTEYSDIAVDIDDETYCQQVRTLKQNIIEGDIFQVVPSRTFSLPCEDSLAAYEALKRKNPSPYMFYMKTHDFVLFGASPESALKYTASTREVEVYPIAGTRPRALRPDGSVDNDLDGRVELELRNDQKERAEHLMLVDLARNDISRIAVPGSRYVAELLKVDRYSCVMHLVSRVTGKLKKGLDALHAYQACMNMGTLVGAPKIKAASLIREVENKRRGSYGGAIGYLNGNGDMDTCIVIRSAFVRDNIAYIQAGAGVVFDSDPQSEADETRAKAQAVINAIKDSSQQTNWQASYDQAAV